MDAQPSVAIDVLDHARCVAADTLLNAPCAQASEDRWRQHAEDSLPDTHYGMTCVRSQRCARNACFVAGESVAPSLAARLRSTCVSLRMPGMIVDTVGSDRMNRSAISGRSIPF